LIHAEIARAAAYRVQKRSPGGDRGKSPWENLGEVFTLSDSRGSRFLVEPR